MLQLMSFDTYVHRLELSYSLVKMSEPYGIFLFKIILIVLKLLFGPFTGFMVMTDSNLVTVEPVNGSKPSIYLNK